MVTARQLFNLHFSKDKEFVKEVFNISGFIPKEVFLYKLALTHSSSLNSVSKKSNKRIAVAKGCNERLEFLGDAVLELAATHHLFEKYPDAISDTIIVTPKISGVNRIYSLDDVKKQAPAAQYEIDLHIEKLIPDWKDLSNADILRIQLSTFEKNYDLAILHHQPYMFVIHGVGEGVLRDAIHERLRKKEEVKTFVNEYHPRYGFGATEINFQY